MTVRITNTDFLRLCLDSFLCMCFQYHLLKRPFSSLYCLWFFAKISWLCPCSLFTYSLFWSVDLCVYFFPIPRLDYCNFAVSLEIKLCQSLQCCLVYPFPSHIKGLLLLLAHFRINSSVSTKDLARTSVETALTFD